ncbi:ATP-dependent helicase HrpB [Planctomyces sp. SH-PL62]|uniref:ATP-dependent helicase HrpB n=1 Tax=Planctomyces sp. SH-PL62 TaxID=1636152 RepID=UPI00078BF736|nr:ATP-dependent helicase HrpB [Planctomyces sp. SH-PL62]AMV37568.1 ATP-dependent RNA helicase HrpB [Planctomyces sp. SH-PL62]
MIPLPIDPSLPGVLDALKTRGALVLVAEPGSGKTTRVPPAIVRAGGAGQVVVLQPRRVAARSTAARIADEQGWTLGREVGYHVRFDRKATAATRLLIMTEGILTRRLLADPFLDGVGTVVLDEFHERSLHTDLAIALLREIRREVRTDLRLVVMSATLDAGPVARFLDAPVIEVPGRTFPISASYRDAPRPTDPATIAGAVADALADPADRGHVLVFLPGMAEIRRAHRELSPIASRFDARVLPLHGSLPSDEQDAALRPSHQRKIILSTNIAETSLTIDGVTTVVDSGLARVAHHDASRGLDRLDLQAISRASADQRAGRAGRTGPGRAIRLWSEQRHALLEPFDAAEVHRVDLGAVLLTLHSWGVTDPGAFGWYEAPAADRIEAAEALLARLGAFDAATRRITPTGERMLALPVHPRLARLLLAAADEGLLHEGAALAALLSEKDVAERRRPGGHRGLSDMLGRLDLLAEAEAARFSPALQARGIDAAAARQVAKVRDDLVRLASRLGLPEHGSDLGDDAREQALLRLLILAYPDRVVRRRGSEETGVMVGGRGVRLARESVVRDGEFFLALDPRETRWQGTLELQVGLASAVRLEWLEELVPQSIRRERSVEYDLGRERVVAMNRLWYEDLLIREDPARPPDAREASRALFEALRPRAREVFRQDSAASAWLSRYDFVREAVPELGWAELSDEALAGPLEVLCHGKTRADQVRQAGKVAYLESLITPAQNRELAACAPESLTIPSGRRVQLTYEPGRQPTLSAKLQELFGWPETPRLARGRVPLLLELLGPNQRPVQVTADLKNFWTNTYHQVRKDLRGRYPKHPWPEDPTTAQAPVRTPRPR